LLFVTLKELKMIILHYFNNKDLIEKLLILFSFRIEKLINQKKNYIIITNEIVLTTVANSHVIDFM
jgi:hypothetical protein